MSSDPLTEQAVGDVIAITNVSVISMATGEVEPPQTVVVTMGRISAISAADVNIPSGATRIDGSGKFLVPGLMDMHVHVRRSDAPAYVQHGVTSVRNMWGYAALRTLERTADGALVYGRSSPAIYSVSPGLDGPNVVWPETRVVASATDAVAAVAEMSADGWSSLKVYSSLSTESYDAIVAEARKRGLPIVGHVPFAISVHHALAEGQRSIEHLGGYDRAVSGGLRGAAAWQAANRSLFANLASATRTAGTWNCPTNVVLDALSSGLGSSSRERATEGRRAMVAALHSAGARLLAGSDAGIDVTAPGTSIHDELAELVAAGLTPYEALRAATIDAAEFLERSSEVGTVTVGKRGDLILLSRNPVSDIANTRSIDGVMVRGAWFSR